MIFKKKADKADLDEFLKETSDAEIDLFLHLKKSNKYHKFVSAGFFFLAAISGVAVTVMAPLKESVPYLLIADKTTGTVDSLSALTPDKINSNQAITEYFIRQYVTNRESYQGKLIQTYYDKTIAFSDENVGQEYDKIFSGKNALDKKYGDNLEIITNVTTIIPDLVNKKAVVRFEKTYIEANKEPRTELWSGDVSYFFTPKEMKIKQRAINPIGFTVDAYRSSQETSR